MRGALSLISSISSNRMVHKIYIKPKRLKFTQSLIFISFYNLDLPKKEVLIFDFLILFICTILIIVIYLPYRSYLQHEKLFSLFKERGGVVVASRYTRSRLLLLGFLVSKFW